MVLSPLSRFCESNEPQQGIMKKEVILIDNKLVCGYGFDIFQAW